MGRLGITFCLLSFLGCGVKTAPKSLVIETVPAIPFHPASENPLLKKDKEKSGSKTTGESKDANQEKP